MHPIRLWLDASRQMVLREFIETKHVYKAAYDALLQGLRRSGTEVAAKYDEGQYYAGTVLSAIIDALDPIMKAELSGRVRRNLFLNTKMVEVDPDLIITNAGASVRDVGHGLIFTVSVPKAWFTVAPKMFFYIVRDNCEEWSRMLARSFAHEILHAEQTLRSEAGVADLDHAAIKARIGTRSRPHAGMRGRPEKPGQLARKNEIDAQALSAALELEHLCGGAEAALDLFRQQRAAELAHIARDPFAAPHLHGYWREVRSDPHARETWKAFLKAVIKHIGAR